MNSENRTVFFDIGDTLVIDSQNWVIVLYERKGKAQKTGKDHHLISEQLTIAIQTMTAAEKLHEHVEILATWLQYDVLQLPGAYGQKTHQYRDINILALIIGVTIPLYLTSNEAYN